jgi:tetratricopeptide (TPR) repeat protein
MAYIATGRFPEALAEFELCDKIQGPTTSNSVFLGRAFAGAGRRDEALAIAKKLAESKQYLAPSEIATLYAALGDHEKAFAALEKAFAERDLQLRFDPERSAIRRPVTAARAWLRGTWIIVSADCTRFIFRKEVFNEKVLFLPHRTVARPFLRFAVVRFPSPKSGVVSRFAKYRDQPVPGWRSYGQ